MSNYFPKQIPDLLDPLFNQYISYQDYPSNNDQVMTFYTINPIKIIDKKINNYILPDGCIDLLIDLVNQEINFVAFSKVTHQDVIINNYNYIGIRFKPGAFYNIYHIDSRNVMDKALAFNQVDSFDMSGIFNIKDTYNQITYLEEYLNTKTNQISSFQLLVDQIYNLDNQYTVKTIAGLLGYSSSHTNRLFKINYGYNIKTLLNIIRLHKTLELLIDEKQPLDDIVYLLNYYDLAHLSNEIIKYTKQRPNKFIK